MKRISEFKVAQKGQITVNLPVILIMFTFWFALLSFTNLTPQFCAIIAGSIGWAYWEFAVSKWIRWSIKNGIDKEQLLKIGKRNLLLWSAFKINKEVEKLK